MKVKVNADVNDCEAPICWPDLAGGCPYLPARETERAASWQAARLDVPGAVQGSVEPERGTLRDGRATATPGARRPLLDYRREQFQINCVAVAQVTASLADRTNLPVGGWFPIFSVAGFGFGTLPVSGS